MISFFLILFTGDDDTKKQIHVLVAGKSIFLLNILYSTCLSYISKFCSFVCIYSILKGL